MPPSPRLPEPVLVTGASGLLGECLALRLADAGVRTVGTYLAHPVTLRKADAIAVDLSDERAVERLVRDLRPGCVLHCAAITDVRACEADPAAAREGILGTTQALVRALTERAPETPLAFVSSDLVFDGTAAPYPPGAPAKPLSLYGSLKHEAEGLVLGLARGLVLRTALMAGAPGTHRSGFLGWMLGMLEQAERVELFEDEFRTPVWNEDVAAAVEGLTARGETGIWNAGGPERLSRLEMGRIACEVFEWPTGELIPRKRLETAHGPGRPADVSLDSRATWERIGHRPQTFRGGLERLRASKLAPRRSLP